MILRVIFDEKPRLGLNIYLKFLVHLKSIL